MCISFPCLSASFDVNDNKEVLRDWDFPFIHRNIDNDRGCLEASVIMVYCAAFYFKANSSKNKVTCSWFKFPTEPTLFKKANVNPTKHIRLYSLQENLCLTAIQTREGAALSYPDAKISLKEDGVPTLFPVVEATLMPPIHRTSTTTVHPGSKHGSR